MVFVAGQQESHCLTETGGVLQWVSCCPAHSHTRQTTAVLPFPAISSALWYLGGTAACWLNIAGGGGTQTRQRRRTVAPAAVFRTVPPLRAGRGGGLAAASEAVSLHIPCPNPRGKAEGLFASGGLARITRVTEFSDLIVIV